MDFHSHLGAVTRSVADVERNDKPARAVTLSRAYETDLEDLWDAVTNAERLPRWFAPVSGDLKLGGRFQVQGNASGTIEQCEPPRYFFVTWEFGGDVSWVEVTLEAVDAETARLTLTHTCPVNDHWKKFGPGAVGVGWDLGLLGLALHLVGEREGFDENAFAASPEGKAFILGCAAGWGEAAVAAGEEPEHARASAERTGAFYTGQPAEES